MNKQLDSVDYVKMMAKDFDVELVDAGMNEKRFYLEGVPEFIVCIKILNKKYYGSCVIDKGLLNESGYIAAVAKETFQKAIGAAIRDWSPRLSDLEAFRKRNNEQTNRVFGRVKGVT
jgi:hypothetical protein